jgi:NADPH:quinone reductase-like Zn-dependent oxidoreductase
VRRRTRGGREESEVRAVVVTEHGGPEVLAVRDVPGPEPGPGQVVVDVGAAGVNDRDVSERDSVPPDAGSTPLVAGVEVAGVVRGVGTASTALRRATGSPPTPPGAPMPGARRS